MPRASLETREAPTGVSFVVPVRNGASTLRDALQSIAAQRTGMRPIEIIAVEDGSDDTSPEVLRELAGPLALRIAQGPRRGAAAAVNRGIREARYPIIAQVDQDVVLGDGWLERVVEPLADPAVGAVQGRYVSTRKGSLWARVTALDLDLRYADLPDRVDHVCTGNSVYRADALDAVGLLREDFGYGYDNDLSYRLGTAGYRLAFRADAVSEHRWRDGLAAYFRQQYGFGYGRLDVVAAHPQRITGDAVSPTGMMAQPLIAAASLGSLAVGGVTTVLGSAAGIGRPLLAAGVVLAGATLVERAVAGVRAWQRFGDAAALLFPVVHTVRNLAWVAAMAVWVARRARGHGTCPAASMKPRPAVR
jgi:cellulose synthase/poly-beta-1,6-N-acetylglucosamine synthase-like glycosyltransferase